MQPILCHAGPAPALVDEIREAAAQIAAVGDILTRAGEKVEGQNRVYTGQDLVMRVRFVSRNE